MLQVFEYIESFFVCKLFIIKISRPLMYPYVDEDDDVDEDEDEETPRDYRTSKGRGKQRGRDGFDDVSAINSTSDKRKRKQQILDEIQRREDEEFEGEWGYALIRSLRGKSVGRRLRRKLFKFGMVEILCGVPVTIMAYLAGQNFANTGEWDSLRYGSTLLVSRNLVSLLLHTVIFIYFLVYVAANFCSRISFHRTWCCYSHGGETLGDVSF